MKKAVEARAEIMSKDREREEKVRQEVKEKVYAFTDGISQWSYRFTWKDFKTKFLEPYRAISILRDELGYEVEYEAPRTVYSGHLWWRKAEMTEGEVIISLPREQRL